MGDVCAFFDEEDFEACVIAGTDVQWVQFLAAILPKDVDVDFAQRCVGGKFDVSQRSLRKVLDWSSVETNACILDGIKVCQDRD